MLFVGIFKDGEKTGYISNKRNGFRPTSSESQAMIFEDGEMDEAESAAKLFEQRLDIKEGANCKVIKIALTEDTVELFTKERKAKEL